MKGDELDDAMQILEEGDFVCNPGCIAKEICNDGSEEARRLRLKKLLGVKRFSGKEFYIKEYLRSADHPANLDAYHPIFNP